MKKLISIFLVTVMTFGIFSFSASASYEDFVTKAGNIDKNGSYKARQEYLDELVELSLLLSDEENGLEDVKAAILLMEEEREGLALLLKNAKLFIASVNELIELSYLRDRELTLNTVYEKYYTDDVTIEGVEEALATFLEEKKDIEERVATCSLFIDIVGEMSQLDPEDYLSIKEKLTVLEGYVTKIDTSYTGVSSAYSIYLEVRNEIKAKESRMQDALRYAEEMLAAATYYKKTDYYDRIKGIMESDDYLPDYEGVTGLLEAIEATEEFFLSADNKATEFILAVSASASFDTKGEWLIYAYSKMLEVDLTISGVSETYSHFETILDEYNGMAKRLNSCMTNGQ